MANGRITTGLSKMYVATYAESGGTVSYSGTSILARAVSATMDITSADDNNFYADNILAESAAGQFGGGTLTLTVDGLLSTQEQLILGLPAADGDGWTAYGDNMTIPYVGVGFVIRYMSDGVTSYVPVVLTKVKFNQPSISANTQEAEIDWQTQELTATILRDDTSNHVWMKKGSAESTEAAAAAKIAALLA